MKNTLIGILGKWNRMTQLEALQDTGRITFSLSRNFWFYIPSERIAPGIATCTDTEHNQVHVCTGVKDYATCKARVKIRPTLSPMPLCSLLGSVLI